MYSHLFRDSYSSRLASLGESLASLVWPERASLLIAAETGTPAADRFYLRWYLVLDLRATLDS